MINELYKNSKDGRGLWIGLFLTKNHEENHLETLMDVEPHLTLLHLGRRSRSREELVYIFDSVENLVETYETRKMKEVDVTGVALFYRKRAPFFTKVAVVDSSSVCDFRYELRSKLSNLEYDDVFGFVPHITLPLETESAIKTLDKYEGFKMSVVGVRITCGEAKIQI